MRQTWGNAAAAPSLQPWPSPPSEARRPPTRDLTVEDRSLHASYASWRSTTLGSVTDRVELRLLLEAAGDVSGRHVLDVGCGDGTHLRALAERGAGGVGVDLSAGMLAEARGAAGPRLSFVRADAKALPFEANSFDLVWAVTVLCLVDDAPGAVCEMARVLRPGGRLVVGDLGRWSTWAARRRVKAWLGWSEAWKMARFWSAAQLRRVASSAGLREPRVRGGVFFPHVGELARILEPLDPWVGSLGTFGAAFLVLTAEK